MKYDFLDYDLISRLGAIPLESRELMLGNSSGRHRSPLRGSSVEFAEYRKYVQGDDTRRLDWKAYARSDKYFIKEFEADTNLRLYVVVDTSGSMNFDYSGTSKIFLARKLAATLAYLATDQGDAAGLIACSDKVNVEVPPRGRASHVQKIFKILDESEPEGLTGLVEALHVVAEKAGRRAMVVVCSDFFCDQDGLVNALQHLRHLNHDVTLFHLMDPQEIEFDFHQPHRFVDMEDDTDLIVEPRVIDEEYREAMTQYLQLIKDNAYDAGVDYRLIKTTDDVEDVLSGFLLDRQLKGGKQ